MSETYSFDRQEGDVCVLVGDAGGQLCLPAGELPPDARPGDLFRMVEGVFAKLPEETEDRRRQVLSLQERLRRRNK